MSSETSMTEQDVVAIQPHEELVLAVVQVDRLDETRTTEMQTAVYDAAHRERRHPVVLDLTRVEFFPSLSLGALVQMIGEFKKSGRRFMLVGLQSSVRGALAVTRLDKLFEIYDSVEDALTQMKMGRTEL